MWLGWLWTKGDSMLEKQLRYTNRRLWLRYTSLADQHEAVLSECANLKQSLQMISRIGETDTISPMEGLMRAKDIATQTLVLASHFHNSIDEDD